MKDPEDNRNLELYLSLENYDNLITRKSLWFSHFQSIQYHPGQFKLLIAAQEASKASILFAMIQDESDIHYLETVFRHLNIPFPQTMSLKQLDEAHHLIEAGKSILVFVKRSNESYEQALEERLAAWDFFDSMLKLSKRIDDLTLTITPVVLTKDEQCSLGWGSICVQVLEPYRYRSLMRASKSSYPTNFIVRHLYYDLASNSVVLPSNIIAFLLLNLDRLDGITMQDLVPLVDWLRKRSIDLNLHIGFYGSSSDVVEFGLMALGDSIKHISGRFFPKDLERLFTCADVVTQIVVYTGIVAKAILEEFNRSSGATEIIMSFHSSTRIRVLKENVLKLSCELADAFHKKRVISYFKPCQELSACLEDVILQMGNFHHYFFIEEPKIKPKRPCAWAGDGDSDDEYYDSNKDNPAFKTWIVLTQKDRRLDRLNLFKNSIEHYL